MEATLLCAISSSRWRIVLRSWISADAFNCVFNSSGRSWMVSPSWSITSGLVSSPGSSSLAPSSVIELSSSVSRWRLSSFSDSPQVSSFPGCSISRARSSPTFSFSALRSRSSLCCALISSWMVSPSRSITSGLVWLPRTPSLALSSGIKLSSSDCWTPLASWDTAQVSSLPDCNISRTRSSPTFSFSALRSKSSLCCALIRSWMVSPSQSITSGLVWLPRIPSLEPSSATELSSSDCWTPLTSWYTA